MYMIYWVMGVLTCICVERHNNDFSTTTSIFIGRTNFLQVGPVLIGPSDVAPKDYKNDLTWFALDKASFSLFPR